MKPQRQDQGSVGLDELRHRLTETDLIPSQEPLLEGITARFDMLNGAGTSSVGELRRELRNPKSLAALAEASGVDAAYLALLKRALGGFFPKARALKDFTWLDQKTISGLRDAGIKNTNQFNQAAKEGIAELEQTIGLHAGALTELAPLADICRVQWVSPNFAGALVAGGYQTAEALAEAEAETLHQSVASANERFGFYGVSIGLRDIRRVIQAARYVDWTTRS